MRFIWGRGPFILLVLIGFWILFFSIWGVIFNNDWIQLILISYFILIIILTVLIIFISKKTSYEINIIMEFEKKLKGGLYHFKCPICNGIFAIKKSSHKNKKSFKLTCPDCGRIGIISSNPLRIKEKIPENKSTKADFRCCYCREGITIWAEGSELFNHINVYSCPYCGEETHMIKI